MPKLKRNEFPDFAKMGKNIEYMIRKLPTVSGTIAVNFFKDSFTRKGFINKSFEKWQPRQNDDDLKGSLMLVSANLKRSIKKDVGSNYVIVSSDTAYSKAHNEGLTIRKRSSSFKMPKRQFMGKSEVLMKRIELNFNKQLKAIIKRDMP